MGKQFQQFRPLRGGAKRRRFVVFDVEGVGGAEGFICGAAWSEGGGYFFTDRLDMLGWLLSRENVSSWLVAHNLEYDLPILAGPFLSCFDMLFLSYGLLWADYHDKYRHRWRFVDSCRIFPAHSVEDLGRIVGLNKLKLPSELSAKMRGGGPWSRFTPEEQVLIREYNIRDARIVYLALQLFQEEVLSLGGQLHETIAGTSMDIFRRAYQHHTWRTPSRELNAIMRKAYYGGRVEPFKIGVVQGLNHYDYSSLYPSVQATIQFPHPDYLRLEYRNGRNPDIERGEGVALATVSVPETYVPPLPARESGRLFFPTGRWQSVWTLSELRYAVAQGTKLERVEWAIKTGITFNPFEEFIEEMYKRRQLYASAGDSREWVFKLILNSAYGRYGVKPGVELFRLVRLEEGIDFKRYRGMRPLRLGDELYVLEQVSSDTEPVYACVIIAAYITAGARQVLHQSLLRAGSSLVYTDTDSIMTRSDLPESRGLGGLRLLDERVDGRILAAKEYVLSKDGVVIRRCAKGVPPSVAATYLYYGRVRFERPAGIREALRSGRYPAEWITVRRERTPVAPKRAPVGGGNPMTEMVETRPWGRAELREIVSPGPRRA